MEMKIFLILAAIAISLVFQSCALREKSVKNEKQTENFLEKTEIFDFRTGKIISIGEYKKILNGQNAVYILEKHDEFFHHLSQAETIELMGDGGKRKIAIGFEMFNKEDLSQKWLDKYNRGEINKEELIKNAWRWGFDHKIYDQILSAIPKYPALALNIDFKFRKGITAKIAANGFESLLPEEKIFFPPDGFKIPCDKGGAENYHRAIMGGFEAMKQIGIMSDKDEERFHIGQWTMNEIMARSILEYFGSGGSESRAMAIIVGSLHGLYNNGILS
ncbi:MAG: ChaN family lipoprotein, partial [Patescibacteria group bacterium]